MESEESDDADDKSSSKSYGGQGVKSSTSDMKDHSPPNQGEDYLQG